jgi:hypothetical protein
MNGKQAKRCRAAAWAEAQKRNEWEIIRKTLGWRRLLAFFFPALKRKYMSWVGKAYKKTLKMWLKEVYAYSVLERPQRIKEQVEKQRLLRAQFRAAREREIAARKEREASMSPEQRAKHEKLTRQLERIHGGRITIDGPLPSHVKETEGHN